MTATVPPHRYDSAVLSDGEMFAGYRIVRQLGAGGMGEVYLAQHPRLSRQDAIKILPAELTADRAFAERFRREADLTASLWHPHIVGVHDRGEFDGRLWISMDFVDGTDAAHLLASSVAMAVADVVAIVDAIADALDFAHQRGLLHRDVKPANILMTAGAHQRRILLADFGIGREIAHTSGLTATNMTIGTVSYAAPEQLMGESIDGRADQYALGATAFHLLTGRPVFDHSNPAIVISRHLNAAPPPLSDRRPELAALDNVVKRALAKDPADRFTCCANFAQELRAAAERTEGLGGIDTGRSARTQVVGGSTVSPTAPTQLAPISAGVNPPAADSPAPAKQGPESQRLIVGGAVAVVALVTVVASIALWPRGVQSNSPTESAIQATSSPITVPNRPAGVPTAASSSTTPPPSHLSPAPIPAQPSPAAVKVSPSRPRFRLCDHTIRQNRLSDSRR